ncbi:hypothetical protein N7457_005185 [Penicillium paradoxum]|uniref:uncharacterized protein n=1 Tax=Penicillium paradoxum TaxID=176176 RepID=UPI002546585B|nr:uncharacterized protein N7457_005185 [Penicillium paradoxum]KAJ5780025.1 hypothetical protein N7457_005185 [Penicillium paradoxum]
MSTAPYSEWEPYKATIERIYIHEGKTQRELGRIMTTAHGFRKTKAQYEKAFERWGFKKYKMTSEKWKFIKHRMEKRKRENGKESEVYINGVRCPPRKVRYEIGRHAFESTMEKFTSVPSPKTPEGVIVCSPEPTTWQPRWPSNLPWFYFSRIALSQTLQGNLLSEHPSNSLALQSAGSVKTQLRDEMTHVLGNLLAQKRARSLEKILNATMPEEYDNQHQVVSEKIHCNSELHLQEFVQIAMFLLSNNQFPGHYGNSSFYHVEHEYKKGEVMMNILRLFGGLNISNMRRLVSLKGATAEAISEKLFECALRTSDLEVIQTMLEAGMSPDSPITTAQGTSLSPLVHAARLTNTRISCEMTRLLLKHKADLNHREAGKSALGLAINFGNEELLKLLLSNGVQLPPRPLRFFHQWVSPTRIIQVLLDAGLDIEERPARNTHGTLLGYAVKKGYADLATLLLSRGADVDTLHPIQFNQSLYSKAEQSPDLKRPKVTRSRSHRNYETTALGFAACRGDVPMMQRLLAANATVNRTDIDSSNYIPPLVLAVNERKPEATALLLKKGANLHAADEFRASHETTHKTLFERALDANDLQMCKILLAGGAKAEEQSMQNYCSSQLWDHAEQRDTAAVAQLLRFGARPNDLREGLPNSALGLAIMQGNWTMISLLQRGGATGVGHMIPFIASVETAVFLQQVSLLAPLLAANGRMILIAAIIAENQALINLLLSHRADQQGPTFEIAPSKPETNIRTPLEAAMCCGNLKLAQYIISRGGKIREADINAIMWRARTTQDEYIVPTFIDMFGPFTLSCPTVIAAAICANDEALIHLLLRNGIDPRGTPEMMIKSRGRNILKPKSLLFPHTYEILGWWNPSSSKRICYPLDSVLEWAVMQGNQSILQALLGATTWTREEKGRALSLSLHFWERRFFRDLLDADADIHQDFLLIDKILNRPSEPVRLALMEHDVSLLRTLLGVDPIIDHIKWHKYMQYAIQHGSIEQIKILLRAEPAPKSITETFNGDSILQTAAKAGRIEIVHLLLEAGADVNEIQKQSRDISVPGKTALQIAGEAGNIELMKILLRAGANIQTTSMIIAPKSTLWHAVQAEDLEVVDIVLKAGADVNEPPVGYGGMTPLQCAAKQGNMELVDLLLQAGANVNQDPAARGGATALQFAAIQGYIGIARKLLDAGASVQANKSQRYGRTALEGAAEHGRLDMLQLLLNEGVLIEGPGRIEYIRAIKLAQNNAHHAVARFLRSFSDWTESDSVCYEEQLFDQYEEHMLVKVGKMVKTGFQGGITKEVIC